MGMVVHEGYSAWKVRKWEMAQKAPENQEKLSENREKLQKIKKSFQKIKKSFQKIKKSHIPPIQSNPKKNQKKENHTIQ